MPDHSICPAVEQKTQKNKEQRDQQKEFLVMFSEDGEKLLGQPRNITINHMVKVQVKQDLREKSLVQYLND